MSVQARLGSSSEGYPRGQAKGSKTMRNFIAILRRKVAAEREFILHEIAVAKAMRNLQEVNTSREQLEDLCLSGEGVENQAALRIVFRQNDDERDRLIAELNV